MMSTQSSERSIMSQINNLLILIWVCAATSQSVRADDGETNTVLDQSPVIVPRVDGFGGAGSALVDDVDAVYYNPAGIGGRGTNYSLPLRKFFFPRFSLSANDHAKNYYNDFQKANGQQNKLSGSAVTNDQKNLREYARANVMLGVVAGRVAVLPYFDDQIAAVPLGLDQVKLRERSSSGVLTGFSYHSEKRGLSIGLSGDFFTASEVNGTFAYNTLANSTDRADAFKLVKANYNGNRLHSGLQWGSEKGPRPGIGIAIRDMGSKTFKSSTTDDTLFYPEDLAVAFKLSPRLGSWGHFNYLLEGSQLGQNNTSIPNKLHTGVEVLFGHQDSLAHLGLRTGYSSVGMSGGVFINAGLLSIEGSTRSVNIGTGNQTILERRYQAVAAVNLGLE